MGTSEPRPSQKRALGSFRKVSKPLMEKRRRARINLSLEQLKALLETHWSHQIRKRKLEKADILELSVKYMRSLHQAPQGAPATKSADYQAGFRSCLQGVRQFLLRSDAARALASPPRLLLHDLARALPGGGLSTADSGHGAAAPAALPEPRPVAPLGSRAETSPSDARRRPRPLKGQPRARAGEEDSIPASGGRRQGPSGQDRLPQRSHPLWRPW